MLYLYFNKLKTKLFKYDVNKINPYIFYTLTAILINAIQIIFLKYSYLPEDDTNLNTIPFAKSFKYIIESNVLPQWYHNVAGGVDLYTQGFFIYGLNIVNISRLFPVWFSQILILLICSFCAGYFTRKIFDHIADESNILGYFIGLIFQSSVYLTSDIAYNLFPIFIWSLLLLNKNNSNFSNILLFLSIIIYSSTVVIYLHFTYFLLAALIIILYSKEIIFKLSVVTASFILTILISIPNILRLIENRITSHRNSNIIKFEFDDNIFFTYAKYDSLIYQILFTIIFIILIMFSIKNINTRKILLLYFIFSLGTSIIITIQYISTKYLNLHYLSGISMQRFGYPFFLIFCISIGTIYKDAKYNNKNYITLINIIFIFLIFDFIYLKVTEISKYLVKGHSFANLYNNPNLKYIKNIYNNSVPFRTVHYPGGYAGSVGSNIAIGYGLETAGGFTPMASKKYVDLWNMMISSSYEEYLNMKNTKSSSLNFSFKPKYNLHEVRNKNKYIYFNKNHNTNILSLLNVKYIYSQIKIKDKSFIEIYELNSKFYIPGYNWDKLISRIKSIFIPNNTYYYIYKNNDVIPRFFFVNNIISFNDEKKLLKYMYFNSDKLKNYIPTLSNKYVSTNSIIGNHVFKIIEYSSDMISLKINIDGDINFVVLSNNHVDWKAYTNMGEKEIMDAYHSFFFVRLNKEDEYLKIIYR